MSIAISKARLLQDWGKFLGRVNHIYVWIDDESVLDQCGTWLPRAVAGSSATPMANSATAT